MSDETVMTITVQYKHRDGWHVFSSHDLPGLYVASKDPNKAYEDVPIALKALLDMDYSCEWEVIRAESYDEFIRRIQGDDPQPAPQLDSRSFVVRGRKGDCAEHAY